MDELRTPKKLKVIKETLIEPGIYNDSQGNPTTKEVEVPIEVCPNCEYDFAEEEASYYGYGILCYVPKYCPNCGQALIWRNGK